MLFTHLGVAAMVVALVKLLLLLIDGDFGTESVLLVLDVIKRLLIIVIIVGGHHLRAVRFPRLHLVKVQFLLIAHRASLLEVYRLLSSLLNCIARCHLLGLSVALRCRR